MSPSVTMSAAAQTSTNAIPNLKGGAHPATPKLAGIICGSCLVLAWAVCLIYWWMGRGAELQARREMEAMRRMKDVRRSTASPLGRRSSRASAQPYPPGTKVLSDQKLAVPSARPGSPDSTRGGQRPPSLGRSRPDFHGRKPLTPMTEVPTNEENGSSLIGMNVFSGQ